MQKEDYKPYNKMYKNVDQEENNKVAVVTEPKNDVPVEEAGPKEEVKDIIKEEPAKVEAKEPAKKAKIVAAAFVNFRQKPVMDNTPPIGVLARDTGIEVVSDKLENDFYKVRSLNKTGYIHKNYVEIL